MQNFHNVFVDKCIQNWYNTENCCLQQKNVKHTKKRERERKTKGLHFDVSDLSSSSSNKNSSE